MKIGSLFSGYGGLDLAVEQALGAETVWVSDIAPGANKILAHRRPDVPNLGDITAIQWADVPHIDILTGGFPCQDLSLAGKRAGLRDGTRSGLWTVMADAIQNLQPRLVVIENVRGILSANAHSRVEPCAWCVGETPNDGLLRALGCVLGDLANIGYDAQWNGLRAADIGAPHGRFRVFIVAYPAAANPGGFGGDQAVEHDGGRPEEGNGASVFDESDRVVVRSGPDGMTLLPTPVADNSRGLPSRGTDFQSLPNAVCALLPTPRATDGTHGGPNQRGSKGDLTMPSAVHATNWGDYAEAIHRWETIHGPTPAPTTPGNSGPRLNPVFVEWMMGLPPGWVTDVPGLTRTQQLKALGNGVHPYQAAEALRRMGGAGMAYELPTSAHHTAGSGSSLLPTPTTRDYKDYKIRRDPHRPNDRDTLSRALTQVLPK